MNIVAIHEMNNESKSCFISWRKKPFKCEYSGYPCKVINQNFAPFHEENKPFECEYFGYSFSQKES